MLQNGKDLTLSKHWQTRNQKIRRGASDAAPSKRQKNGNYMVLQPLRYSKCLILMSLRTGGFARTPIGCCLGQDGDQILQ